ncbi:RidA family protein [candidate division KSB1 bacterium]
MKKRVNLLAVVIVILCIGYVTTCNTTQQDALPAKTVITGDTVVPTYSPGVLVGNTLYLAGKIGINPETSEIGDNIRDQTRFALEAFKPVLDKAGMSMSDIVSVNVYLTHLDDYEAMNEVYTTFFPKDPPARATVAVLGLVRGALIEISCIAVKSQ